MFDASDVGEKFKSKTSNFSETFDIVKDNDGKEYILQRDLYAAAKMIYCIPHIEKRGKKEVTVWEFDQEGFEKFFSEKFYPKQEKYIKELIKQKNLGVKLSGTILGD